MITDGGCWADFRVGAAETRGRPCLFLDRDGVLIEDTGFPHRPAAIVPIPETQALVRAANRRNWVVGIVTNQSGLARGLFDWPAFAAVQAVIDAALAADGAHVDFVLACPHHPDAVRPGYRHAAHPWRKPAPGMMLAAAEILALDLARSALVGDRPSDMEAARQAGIPDRLLLTEDTAPGPWVATGRSALLGSFDARIRWRLPGC